jgi:2-keto-4-pentenoate hydratase/2-oxohepta-3-ene-1,7-dioic acid hydratase in catechol pathway
MRWVTFEVANATEPRVGRLVDDRIFALPRGTSLVGLLGDDGERLSLAGERTLADPDLVIDLDQVRLLPPILQPPTVRDFYAFEQHVRLARERRGAAMSPDWYQLPVFYFTNPLSLIGDGADVAAPPDCAELDFELEVAAVVGMAGSNLAPRQAEQHLAGYTIMNDWSARDIQRREMSIGLGPAKAKDFATSLGPCLVTSDELDGVRRGHAFDLTMVARVNGREYSRASLAAIYWSFGEMLAYASRASRIVPGDVVGSGTCGTGCILELSSTHGGEAFPWLKPGDVVELEVSQLGRLTNRVVEGIPAVQIR